MKWLKRNIQNFLKIPLVKRALTFLTSFTLPGFSGIPVYDILVFMFKESRKDLLPTRARSMAFSFFISFFPAIIFLLTLLPYIPLRNLKSEFFNVINELIPSGMLNVFVQKTVDDLLNTPRGGLLSFGAFLTLYFSTQGVQSMIMTFNKTYSIYTQRNQIELRLASLRLTLILFLLLVSSVSVILISNSFLYSTMQAFQFTLPTIYFVTKLWQIIVILMIVFLAISFIYYYGPSTTEKWSFINPGAVVATLTIIFSSFFFKGYINNFDKYNSIYGVFGSIILFLTWLYIIAFVILIGFEINAAIYYKQSLLESKKK